MQHNLCDCHIVAEYFYNREEATKILIIMIDNDTIANQTFWP